MAQAPGQPRLMTARHLQPAPSPLGLPHVYHRTRLRRHDHDEAEQRRRREREAANLARRGEDEVDPRTDEPVQITLSLTQLRDLQAALDLPEGVYQLRKR